VCSCIACVLVAEEHRKTVLCALLWSVKPCQDASTRWLETAGRAAGVERGVRAAGMMVVVWYGV
jgi:hypothetical protein